jgi:hypothetical protein
MSAELIYKTTSAEALEALGKYNDRATEVHAVWNVFQARANALVPPPEGMKRRELSLSQGKVIGITCSSEEERHWTQNYKSSPEGWRLSPYLSQTLIPRKNTSAGRALDAEIAQLPPLNIRSSLERALGIPEMVFVRDRMYSPGLDTDENESGAYTAIYVAWGSGKCASDFIEGTTRVAPSVEWTEVLRSEWYAREEAKESK